MKPVVITGVSTGIGLAAAHEMLSAGYHVFGTVRKNADADRLCSKLGKSFTPLLLEVTDLGSVKAAAAKVGEALGEQGLVGLVNNAGIAVGGPLMHIRLDDFRRQFEVNVFGVLAVTQAFLPLLGAKLGGKRAPGRIINISSVSGRVVYPFIGPYAASKHALEAISHAFRRELLPFGIDVIIVAPGSTVTAVWEKGAKEGIGHYADTEYASLLVEFQKTWVARGRRGLPAFMVARTIREALESPRPKTRYALSTNPIRRWLLPRYVPDRWLDKLIGSRLGLLEMRKS